MFPIDKVSMEEARYGADLPGNESSIPMIDADFPRFKSGSWSIEVDALQKDGENDSVCAQRSNHFSQINSTSTSTDQEPLR